METAKSIEPSRSRGGKSDLSARDELLIPATGAGKEGRHGREDKEVTKPSTKNGKLTDTDDKYNRRSSLLTQYTRKRSQSGNATPSSTAVTPHSSIAYRPDEWSEERERNDRIASEVQKSQASGESDSTYGTAAIPSDAELFERYTRRRRATASKTTPKSFSTQSEECVGEKSRVPFFESISSLER